MSTIHESVVVRPRLSYPRADPLGFTTFHFNWVIFLNLLTSVDIGSHTYTDFSFHISSIYDPDTTRWDSTALSVIVSRFTTIYFCHHII